MFSPKKNMHKAAEDSWHFLFQHQNVFICMTFSIHELTDNNNNNTNNIQKKKIYT